jgi:hypothetical protein
MSMSEKWRCNLLWSFSASIVLESNVCQVEGNFRMERWIHFVLDAVCELYYTDYYTSFRKTAMFVGTAENVAVSIDVAQWLIESIRKESNRLYKDNYQRRSFRLGAAWQILSRAIDMVCEEKAVANCKTPGTSLAIVRDQLERANQNFLSRLNLRQTKRRCVYIDKDSFDYGSIYGNGVRLGKESKRLPQFA